MGNPVPPASILVPKATSQKPNATSMTIKMMKKYYDTKLDRQSIYSHDS